MPPPISPPTPTQSRACGSRHLLRTTATYTPGGSWAEPALPTPTLAGIINAAGHFAASSLSRTDHDLFGTIRLAATYAADFQDITYGACNYYSGFFASIGYDLCTGLGSPKGLMGK